MTKKSHTIVIFYYQFFSYFLSLTGLVLQDKCLVSEILKKSFIFLFFLGFS
jgi:hypothetical protein